MNRTRDLDFTPLTRPPGPAARLRVVADDHLTLVGATVVALLVVVPLVVLVALVATGNATDVGGIVLLVGCLAGGLYGAYDVWAKAGPAAGLGAFARANALELQRSVLATHYAGSLFADGTHVVRQSVRTRDDAFLEVGDRFPVPRQGARRPQHPSLFLRAGLSGRVAGGAPGVGWVPAQLHDAIERFAGPHSVEVTGDELTLFGTRALDPGRPGRVEKAIELLDRLVEHAESQLVAAPDAPPATTSSGVPVPERPRPAAPRGRRRGPLRVVGVTLALMVVGPLAIAVVMSTVDDQLRGNDVAAELVVALLVAVALLVVARVVRSVVTPRSDRGDAPRDAG